MVYYLHATVRLVQALPSSIPHPLWHASQYYQYIYSRTVLEYVLQPLGSISNHKVVVHTVVTSGLRTELDLHLWCHKMVHRHKHHNLSPFHCPEVTACISQDHLQNLQYIYLQRQKKCLYRNQSTVGTVISHH